MLNTTFVTFWQLSVPSTCVPGSLCLDVLFFCSGDVTSNLSHQLLCFIMWSYCSHFIIVYNYIFVIILHFSHFMFIYFVSLFIIGRRKTEDEEELCFLRPVFHTKHTYIIPFQTTQNNTNKKFTIQQWTDTMFCLSINKHCCN